VTSKGSKSRIRWEGDSQAEIQLWPKDVKADIGLELHRLDNREEPLDSVSMGKVLPGVSELRDRDKDFWYRVFYTLYAGSVYVLHCFKKKTNKTSQGDIQTARKRLAAVKARKDESGGEGKKSA